MHDIGSGNIYTISFTNLCTNTNTNQKSYNLIILVVIKNEIIVVFIRDWQSLMKTTIISFLITATIITHY